MEQEKKKIINKWDIILLAALLLMGVISLWGIRIFSKTGDAVYIYEDGKVIDTKDISVDGTYVYKTELGENTVVLENGTVSVKQADCKDKLCVKQGSIDSDRETIICLPHKFIVEVRKR